MISVGDVVSFTDEALVALEAHGKDLEKELLKLRGEALTVREVREINREDGEPVLAVHFENHLWPTITGIIMRASGGFVKNPKISIFKPAAEPDLLCPECHRSGEVMGMACVCRNSECTKHIIWGA